MPLTSISWKWWALLALAIILVIIRVLAERSGERSSELGAGLFNYRRKKYLFDTNSEFELYKVLVRLYANQYRIFAQVNYSHLIESKSKSIVTSRSERSRIDRKSADFVLCEFESAVPLLVMELDGSAHGIPKKRERDAFIDGVCAEVGLPILHLEAGTFNEASLKALVDAKVTPKVTMGSNII